MKKGILISFALVVAVFILISVQVEPMFYYEGSAINASGELEEINEEIRRRIVDKAVKDIRDNHDAQTPIYNIVECAYISTPNTSLVFTVRNVKDISFRTVQENLNGQTVNMTYMKRKYSYHYRVMHNNSSDEISRGGEIDLENNGNSILLNIPKVQLKVSFRTEHSLFLEHPENYSIHILDSESSCDEPMATLNKMM